MITKREAIDLLGRVTEMDLATLLALKAAGTIAAGGPTLSLVAEGEALGGPRVVVRVRITKKRAARKAGR